MYIRRLLIVKMVLERATVSKDLELNNDPWGAGEDSSDSHNLLT